MQQVRSTASQQQWPSHRVAVLDLIAPSKYFKFNSDKWRTAAGTETPKSWTACITKSSLLTSTEIDTLPRVNFCAPSLNTRLCRLQQLRFDVSFEQTYILSSDSVDSIAA